MGRCVCEVTVGRWVWAGDVGVVRWVWGGECGYVWVWGGGCECGKVGLGVERWCGCGGCGCGELGVGVMWEGVGDGFRLWSM